jgi:CRISPR-associated endoribonuclease Cas6
MEKGLRIEIGINILNYKGLNVKYNLNHEISSFIYDMLGIKYNELHDSLNKKDFCFSNIIFNKCRYSKSIELSNNKGLLLISSIDNSKIEHLFNSLNSSKDVLHKIGNILFIINYVKKYRDDIKINDFGKYRLSLISPVLVSDLSSDNKSCFIGIEDIKYKELLCNNISKIVGKNILIDNINIIDSSIKRKAVEYKGILLKGYLYDIEIKCDYDDINRLYYGGIGNRTALGFGMLKIKK